MSETLSADHILGVYEAGYDLDQEISRLSRNRTIAENVIAANTTYGETDTGLTGLHATIGPLAVRACVLLQETSLSMERAYLRLTELQSALAQDAVATSVEVRPLNMHENPIRQMRYWKYDFEGKSGFEEISKPPRVAAGTIRAVDLRNSLLSLAPHKHTTLHYQQGHFVTPILDNEGRPMIQIITKALGRSGQHKLTLLKRTKNITRRGEN